MNVNHFKGIITHIQKRDISKELLTIKIKMNENQLNLFRSAIYGAVIFDGEQLFYGVIELSQSLEGAERDFNMHILTLNEDLNSNHIIVCCLFKIREMRSFPTQREKKKQIKRDMLSLKHRFNIHHDVLSYQSMAELPDVIFSRMINNCFGINRGIYNTIDLWLWNRGINCIKNRRREILKFSITQMRCKNTKGKVKFGSGQLSKRLEQFWDEEIAVLTESILLKEGI